MCTHRRLNAQYVYSISFFTASTDVSMVWLFFSGFQPSFLFTLNISFLSPALLLLAFSFASWKKLFKSLYNSFLLHTFGLKCKIMNSFVQENVKRSIFCMGQIYLSFQLFSIILQISYCAFDEWNCTHCLCFFYLVSCFGCCWSIFFIWLEFPIDFGQYFHFCCYLFVLLVSFFQFLLSMLQSLDWSLHWALIYLYIRMLSIYLYVSIHLSFYLFI